MQKEGGAIVSCKKMGLSRLPGSHGSTAWQRSGTTTVHGRIQHPNMHLIQHKHLFSDGRLGVIPSKHALSEQIEFGGRGTRVEGEVVVHGVVVGSSGSRDGS